MPLKKKDLSTDVPGSAFVLPEFMAAMASPQTELPVKNLIPAPEGWNFFGALPDGKFLELCDSIAEHGLIHPLLIWEQGDNRHIILSGHNRTRALTALYEATDDPKYLNAPCVVRRGITESEAQSLLTDANWVQRSLTPSEKARCIARRYADFGRLRSGEGGRAYDRVARHFGLKATQVYGYIRIAALPDEVLTLLDKGLLSMRAAALLAKLTAPEREALMMRLGGDITTETVINALRPKAYTTLSFQVPPEKADLVRLAVAEVLAK